MTKTNNATRFADPYKKCVKCGAWVDGVLDVPGPLTLTPCGHEASYRDVCPSWSPVDGCNCRLGEHEMRYSAPGDERVY